MSDRFTVLSDGIRIALDPIEVKLLGDVPSVLASLGAPQDDPAAARLSPAAYEDDADAQEEWHRFAGSELNAARRADRSSFEVIMAGLADRADQGEASADEAEATVSSTVLSWAEAEAFIRVVNDVRLVLGARWNIEGPGDYATLRPEAEHTLAYLGWVVAELGEALMSRFDRA